jgi:hypothetical protein
MATLAERYWRELRPSAARQDPGTSGGERRRLRRRGRRELRRPR